jgi:glycerate kinase
MKIVIAPNAFKESLSAPQVADNIEKGIRKVLPRAKIVKVPLADGGDGTVEALLKARGGKIVKKKVRGPRGKRVDASLGILPDKKTAVIEMALASGLKLLPLKKRNPLKTSTYGTGELIKEALEKGSRKLIIGIGGSATVDGGSGMAQALGAKLLTKDGSPIPRGGGGLRLLQRIDISSMDERLEECEVVVASDVDNPLLGPRGAARVYAPQKGATPWQVEELEKNLARYARVIKRDLKIEVRNIPGSGAAGGLGAGLRAFLKAKIELGAEILIEASGLEEKMRNADLVITGEGKIDSQTIYGKVPLGVARLARKHKIPVIALAGDVREDARVLHREGITACFSILRYPLLLKEALKKADSLLQITAEEVAHLFFQKTF